MRRREFITFACGAAIAWPLAAHAQQAGRLPRVGVLVSASPPHPFAEAFWRGLRPLGYSEGKNIDVEFHYTGGGSERAAGVAGEAVRRGGGVIFAPFPPAGRGGAGGSPRLSCVLGPA